MLIYSINLIYKIIKSTHSDDKNLTGTSIKANVKKTERPNWSLSRINSLIERLLEVQHVDSENSEHVLAVKYKTFNDLLGRLPKESWPDYAFIWILFTCDILMIGLVRDYRNADYEEWLLKQ